VVREADVTPAEQRVIEAARAWWKSGRPLAYTADDHAANPTVNTTTDPERDLAEALAALDAEEKAAPIHERCGYPMSRHTTVNKGAILVCPSGRPPAPAPTTPAHGAKEDAAKEARELICRVLYRRNLNDWNRDAELFLIGGPRPVPPNAKEGK
jgi:hypothetical protein